MPAQFYTVWRQSSQLFQSIKPTLIFTQNNTTHGYLVASGSTQLAVQESTQLTVQESTQLAVHESTQLAVQESTPLAVQESTQLAVQESTQLAVGVYAVGSITLRIWQYVSTQLAVCFYAVGSWQDAGSKITGPVQTNYCGLLPVLRAAGIMIPPSIP